MFTIIGAIISGLVVGAIALWLYPGVQGAGWIATILLGIGGSLLAGLVTSGGRPGFQRAGCLASIVGAIVLIFIGKALGLA